MNFKTKAFIIKIQRFQEADKIVTAIDYNSSKIKFIGKGVSRVQAKMAGYLNLFNYLSIIVVEGRNLNIITSAENIYNFRNLETSLKKAGVAFLISEFLDKLLEEEEKHYGLIGLILNCYYWLDKASDEDAKKIINFFLVCFAEKIGFKPELEKCVECNQKPNPKKIYFDFSKGGIVCADCLENGCLEISANEVKLLRLFLKIGQGLSSDMYLNKSIDKLAILKKIDNNLDNKINKILFNFFEFITDKRFSSKTFLRKIERLNK